MTRKQASLGTMKYSIKAYRMACHYGDTEEEVRGAGLMAWPAAWALHRRRIEGWGAAWLDATGTQRGVARVGCVCLQWGEEGRGARCIARRGHCVARRGHCVARAEQRASGDGKELVYSVVQ